MLPSYNYKAFFIARIIVRCHLIYMDTENFAELCLDIIMFLPFLALTGEFFFCPCERSKPVEK